MKLWWCIFGIIPVLEVIVVPIKITQTCPSICLCLNHIINCQKNELSELPLGIDPNVTSLDLSINNFEKISEDFKFFTKLRHLNMSYNRIATLGHMDFNGLFHLEQLDLSFNYFHDWRDIHSQTLINLKKLTFIDFSNNAVRTLPFNSNHFAVKSLKILKLNNCSLISIPSGFLKTITNITELHLANNPINYLDVKLTSKTLKYMDLSSSTLSYVSDSAFQGLESLENLKMSKNKNLRNITINVNSLINLDISDSLLDTSPYGNMISLQQLNLHGNILREIKNNRFMNMPNLVYLNLSLNAITSIEENAFRGLEFLEILDLSYNKLNYIPTETFLSTKNLIWLDVSHNYLTSLDSISSSSLNILNASYCEINFISKYTLTTLPRLRLLSLKRNFISSIPDHWLAGQIYSLDLSDCRIKSITNYTFAEMSSLWALDLSSNRLTTIHYTNFPSNLQLISIKDNLWRCDCNALMETYYWLQSHGCFTDDLICDSPENVDGENWLTACQTQWYPSSHKKDNLWWYSIILLISLLLLLVTVVVLRKLNEIRENRFRELEEQRRQQEREAREALQRMQQRHREYREEASQNAPDPRDSQGPPSYNDALLLPRLDSSQLSLASLHSFGSRGSLQGSNPEVNKKGKVRRKRRRRRSESTERPMRRVEPDSNESEPDRRERPLESDF
ncbi:leucine-rich repeat-containing protein let-4 [Diorhabda carinulata]|uniref:leucine-rich repeat-containing protein let-4 n=1 Tax=Diorhabda carinulata TaxID=1163345 RepID=UPI0025A16FC6|nr:leucine-rich repeat-containing protein let-4 [Diorhabda carinulata]